MALPFWSINKKCPSRLKYPATGKPKTIFKTIPKDGGNWFKSVIIENVS